MEENQSNTSIIFSSNTNCGLTSGVIELYSDKLVFTSNKGTSTVFEYKDITNARSSMGCLEITTLTGKTEVFSVDKELRLKMVDYINNRPVVQTNKVKQSQVAVEKQSNLQNQEMNNQTTHTEKENNVNTIVGLATLILVGFVIFNLFFGSGSDINSALAIEARVNAKAKLTSVAGTIAESEVDFSVADEKDGKCILKCKTTNKALIELYGKTFYFGYSPNLSNGYTYTYNYYIDTSKSVVKEEIDW